ncbi:ABC transporter ATP-binding protein, partial [Zymobacter palmae]|uniref:Quaternary amine transport ATP-binding protein n=1 Tax=Zymobacter palmae TaxID=33074 RepID=A0A348HGY8_9GAMM
MIELDSLTKQFRQKQGLTTAVDHVNMTVKSGEMCVFLGPSGCGKTTTLKMINRLIEPTSGRILIDGNDTRGIDKVELRRSLGYVIQQVGLFPNMTIKDNIMVVPKLLGWDKKRMHERACELMSMVALEPSRYLSRYPNELSGGQQQRIGVIRALAADPPLLLMDEPFGAIDPINRSAIQDEFLMMQRQLRKTVIMVSHDIDEALKLADKIAMFRDGRLVQFSTPDELLARPADEFVATFTGGDSTLKRLLLVAAGDAVSEPISVSRSTLIADVRRLMDDHERRHIVIVDEHGKAQGQVRRQDIKGVLEDRPVGDYRQPLAVTSQWDDNLRVLLSRMYEYNIDWVPVQDENERFIGEISQDSIIALLSTQR